MFDFRSHVIPPVPLLAFLLQVDLKHVFGAVGVDQLELPLTFDDVAWLDVQVRKFVGLSQPLEP